MNCNDIIKKLRTTRNAERGELIYLLENITDGEREVLRRSAQEVAKFRATAKTTAFTAESAAQTRTPSATV